MPMTGPGGGPAGRRPACWRNPALRAYVAARLGEDWSPEQIAGVLAKDAPIGTGVRVSHETIYKSLFVPSRGVLAKALQQHLRSGRPTRRNIHHTVTGQWRSQIKDAVSIRELPAEVADRAIPGHWEGDRKSTRLNSSHANISYAVFCLKKDITVQSLGLY